MVNCRQWLIESIDVVQPQVLLALGQIAGRAVLDEARRRTWHAGPLPKFGHS
jgi:uracil-DNA glycosylase